MTRFPLCAALLLGLAACAHPTVVSTIPRSPQGSRSASSEERDAHVPDFARRPYVPFNREDAVAIALREWKLFGQPVDDDPPGTRPAPPPELKPEREPGLWERVGEYWWLGIDATQSENAWTGKHDENGNEFPANQDANFAWSAAFISYVMRTAGAGDRFPYAISHSTYINIAAQMALSQTTGWVVSAQRPENYAPKQGDLICEGRGRAGKLHFDDLPTGGFPGHCDIVVAVAPGQLSVIGGNVDDAVTMKHIPVTPDGRIATPDGTVLDTRYPWFVVLQVAYDQETEVPAPPPASPPDSSVPVSANPPQLTPVSMRMPVAPPRPRPAPEPAVARSPAPLPTPPRETPRATAHEAPRRGAEKPVEHAVAHGKATPEHTTRVSAKTEKNDKAEKKTR